LTFIFIESHKIRNRVLLDDSGEVSRDWIKLEQAVSKEETNFGRKEKAISHAANILGRRFEEVLIFMMPLVPPLHQIASCTLFLVRKISD
jgi:hypothetical protein